MCPRDRREYSRCSGLKRWASPLPPHGPGGTLSCTDWAWGRASGPPRRCSFCLSTDRPFAGSPENIPPRATLPPSPRVSRMRSLLSGRLGSKRSELPRVPEALRCHPVSPTAPELPAHPGNDTRPPCCHPRALDCCTSHTVLAFPREAGFAYRLCDK